MEFEFTNKVEENPLLIILHYYIIILVPDTGIWKYKKVTHYFFIVILYTSFRIRRKSELLVSKKSCLSGFTSVIMKI